MKVFFSARLRGFDEPFVANTGRKRRARRDATNHLPVCLAKPVGLSWAEGQRICPNDGSFASHPASPSCASNWDVGPFRDRANLRTSFEVSQPCQHCRLRPSAWNFRTVMAVLRSKSPWRAFLTSRFGWQKSLKISSHSSSRNSGDKNSSKKSTAIGRLEILAAESPRRLLMTLSPADDLVHHFVTGRATPEQLAPRFSRTKR